MINYLKSELSTLSRSMFQKDFFGLYHGSISAKTDSNRFVINKKETVFHNMDNESLIELGHNRDYRWKGASVDAAIHAQIYSLISDAKFISFSMPPYATAYSFNHLVISPQDYFGHQDLKSVAIYDPKSFEDWYDRASSEIPQYFIKNNTNIIVIKGYGVYAYSRDLHSMIKSLAILEKSCRLLMLGHVTKDQILE